MDEPLCGFWLCAFLLVLIRLHVNGRVLPSSFDDSFVLNENKRKLQWDPFITKWLGPAVVGTIYNQVVGTGRQVTAGPLYISGWGRP